MQSGASLPVRASLPVVKALLANALQPADKTMALGFKANPPDQAAIGPECAGSIMTNLA
jgi:hypothetical protein